VCPPRRGSLLELREFFGDEVPGTYAEPKSEYRHSEGDEVYVRCVVVACDKTAQRPIYKVVPVRQHDELWTVTELEMESVGETKTEYLETVR
jgi:hypothetical protein